jgi:predicted ATPase
MLLEIENIGLREKAAIRLDGLTVIGGENDTGKSVELVKNNYNFLLTSHSPYMIQALRVLSEKEEINDRTAFYLAEKNDGKSSFEDVSADLGKLFRKLAEPLNELVT